MSETHLRGGKKENNFFVRTNADKDNDRKNISKPKDKLDDGSELIQVFNPIINVFRVLGSWPTNNSSFIQRFNLRNGITLTIVHLYTFQVLIKFLLNLKERKSIFSIILEIAAIIRTFVVILTLNIRFLKHQKVLKVYKDINDFPTFNQEYKLSILNKTIKKIMFSYFVFVVIQSILSIDASLRETSISYINLIFHKPDSSLTVLDVILMFFNWFSYSFFIICNECLTEIHFLCICLVLRNRIRDFNLFLHHLEQKKLAFSMGHIQQVYQLHSHLTSMVKGIEENFSLQSFLMVVSIISNVCVKIQMIISGIKENNYSLFAFILTDVSYYMVIFIGILLTSNEICKEDSAPVLSVIKIAENGDISDQNFYQEIQLLLRKVNTPIMKLTGWDCFELNKGFMLTIMGALATYSVVVLQLS